MGRQALNVVTVEAIEEILPINFGSYKRIRWQLHFLAATPIKPNEKPGSLEGRGTPRGHVHPPEQAGRQISIYMLQIIFK